MTPAHAVELRHETRLPTEPALVFLNHLGARAILADHERIAPHARPADVGRIRHRPFELPLVEHLRRLTLLHCHSFPSTRPGRSAGPRRRRGATREGDRPAWQGGSEASNRKPGTPGSRAKPLPRSAGVRSRVLVVRCLELPTETA